MLVWKRVSLQPVKPCGFIAVLQVRIFCRAPGCSSITMRQARPLRCSRTQPLFSVTVSAPAGLRVVHSCAPDNAIGVDLPGTAEGISGNSLVHGSSGNRICVFSCPQFFFKKGCFCNIYIPPGILVQSQTYSGRFIKMLQLVRKTGKSNQSAYISYFRIIFIATTTDSQIFIQFIADRLYPCRNPFHVFNSVCRR